MKRKIIVTGGLVIFLSVMSANIQFAISGYGIGTNSLHAEVLAQSSSTGGNTSGEGSSTGDGKWFETEKQKLFYGNKITGGISYNGVGVDLATGEWELAGVHYYCGSLGIYCSYSQPFTEWVNGYGTTTN